jgi:16S rRNA (uracil1498-N3)-methyltransferase
MHQDYFYIRPEDVSENRLEFRTEESRHLILVCRKRTGDVVFAVDGRGNAYEARLVKTNRTRVVAEVLRIHERLGESNVELTLAQGVLKGSRFDWLVEKAVEVGVTKIIPVRTQHSASGAVSGNRIPRLERIALAAMKQSGRSVLPDIVPVQAFDRLLETSADYDLKFIAEPGREQLQVSPEALSDTAPCRRIRILCLVGPEGGFEPSELEKALHQGFHPVSLGPTRLRSETAGIALSFLVISRYGGK